MLHGFKYGFFEHREAIRIEADFEVPVIIRGPVDHLPVHVVNAPVSYDIEIPYFTGSFKNKGLQVFPCLGGICHGFFKMGPESLHGGCFQFEISRFFQLALDGIQPFQELIPGYSIGFVN